jgi:hypothetical protein
MSSYRIRVLQKATAAESAPSTSYASFSGIARVARDNSMRSSEAVRFSCCFLATVLVSAFQSEMLGAPVAARHLEGTIHGYLALHSKEGQVLAVGDVVQVVRGDRVTSHVLFRFKDGSIDDETAVFTQRGNFQLISDHHIQKGPFFPHPMDLSIDVRSGQVTVRSTGKDGKETVTTDHMDLPSDLYNGLIIPIAKNLKPDVPETKVSMVVAVPKPRLVKLAISPRGEQAFSLAGFERKALAYEIKIELGGVAGVVAPLIGKQPPDIQIWIEGGQVPAFVREEGPVFEGSPILSIELARPVWPNESHSESGK